MKTYIEPPLIEYHATWLTPSQAVRTFTNGVIWQGYASEPETIRDLRNALAFYMKQNRILINERHNHS